MAARRRALVLLLTALAAVIHAEPVHYLLSQGGSKIGDSSFDLRADGTFTSDTLIQVAGVKIVSKLAGKLVDGRLTEFTFDQEGPGGHLIAENKDGKAKATLNGKELPAANVRLEKAAFSNYHPGICRTILASIDLKLQGPRVMKISIVDNGGVGFDTKVTPKPGRKIDVKGKNVALQCFTAQLGGVEIEYAADADGAIVAESVTSQKFTAIADGYEEAFTDPVAKYKELSQPTLGYNLVKGRTMKMRDGVELAYDAAMPDGDGKYPVILERTPYGREASMVGAEWWAKRGYVFIVQDCRGRHDSGGVWDPFVFERQDGKDTIDWIAKQPWCNGNVGMIGASYSGYVQWAAAVERPAALKCIVPQVSPPDAMRNIPYDGGIFTLLPNLWWTNLVRDKVSHMERATQPLPHPDKLSTLPLSKLDDAVLGTNVPFFDNWLRREGMSQWHGGYDTLSVMPRVTIPALHISGWWDGDGIGTKLNWATMRAAGHKNQWLIYGPWPHAFNTTTSFAGVDYGPTAVLELDSVYLRWFDTWLKGRSVGFDKVPHVQAFLTGANRWMALKDWPAPESRPSSLYLSGGKSLVSSVAAGAKPARYTYDPTKAAIPKEAKGNIMAAGNMASDLGDSTSDHLVFKSAPLTSALKMTGPISLDLYFSTNVVSTDFFAMAFDIDEKGLAVPIGQPGKLDVRYLQGFDKPRLIKPGSIYKAHIELWDAAHEFKKGHRIALLVMSQMFPTYARNLNTGEPIFGATKSKVAKQVIYQDAKRPSVLKFRVLP